MRFLPLLVSIVSVAEVALADSAENQHAKSLLERDVALGDWGGARTALEDRGVSFGLHYTEEILGVVNGGLRRQAEYNGLVQLDFDLDLEKAVGWTGGAFHATGFAGFGPSLSGRSIGDDSNVSNINMRNGTRLFEAYLQQAFGEKFSLRAGLLATDSEFYDSACDFVDSRGGTLFVNSDFGAIPILSFNVPEPIFPVSAPGVSITITPTDALTFRAAIYDGQPVPADEFDDRNAHGFSPRLDAGDGALILAEVQYDLNKTGDLVCRSTDGKSYDMVQFPRGLGGRYKIGGFYHSGTFTRWSQDRDRRGNGGGYLVGHQMIWRENERDNQGLCVFARLGLAPRDRNVLDLSADGGLHYRGLFPGRDEDDFGVGVSVKRYSPEFSDSERRAGNPGRDRETIFEVSYSAKVTPWLALQPDLQYVLHPAGDHGASDAVVAGVRVTMDF
ncbi:MAG: carbohydrate porin [Chthoniobacteraceae bacterium]